jgi:hypothetical protein
VADLRGMTVSAASVQVPVGYCTPRQCIHVARRREIQWPTRARDASAIFIRPRRSSRALEDTKVRGGTAEEEGFIGLRNPRIESECPSGLLDLLESESEMREKSEVSRQFERNSPFPFICASRNVIHAAVSIVSLLCWANNMRSARPSASRGHHARPRTLFHPGGP